MYTSFYNLKAKPFQISSDPDYLWLGEKHKEALATLKYGVLDNKGFLLMTGDVGTGKTTLINSLIQSLSDDVIYASVSDPSLSKLDFFNFIAAAFGIDKEFSTKGAFIVRFRKFLFDTYEADKKALLIIDESQLLTQELLEEIRLLSNIERTDTKLINIFFVGQNEFNAILNEEKNRAVRQRLTLNYNIDPLTPDEINEYIIHRLNVAGAKEPIFDQSAVQEIFMYSGGFPRRINVICDHALLTGYVKNDKKIGRHIVKECAKELKIPLFVRNRNIDLPETSPAKPIPQQTVRPPVLQPLPPIKEKKKKGNILFGGVLFVCFGLLCWWLMFPVNFQQFMSRTRAQIDLIKINTAKPVSNAQQSSQIASHPGQIEYKVNPNPVDVQPDQNTAGNQNTAGTELIGSENITDDSSASRQATAPDSETLKTSQGDEKTIPTPETSISETLGMIDGIKHLPDDKIPLSNSSVKGVKTLTEKKTATSHTYPDRAAAIALPDEKIIVRFKYNSNDFTEEGFNKLKNFADVLVQYPDTSIRIAGYTDSAGNQNYNLKLSEFRANIVKSFFLGRGVKSGQVEIKGFGSAHPIENNTTAWGRGMNRRVEIEILN